ncbi:DUF1918 domain-containing protein [Streptomyces kaniharaensis]|uniref:DUF1918 domain-containing protein n=1 Tax=Streptomyces kaniharaensis TaxID=212423 RepID=A0A6N7L0H1_9ACTN|nr:DUF1918 domain-containing protein [Streptomyces kaniharaensis]MQS17131.1 DUF1918 domain-containing protein [Streptomyces kaniharaensis]
MKAAVGDRIIVQGTRPGAARRDGEIVGLHHPDGSPPYDVRWSDNDRVTEYFPGPDTRIHHYHHKDEDAAVTVPPNPHLFAD